MTLEAQTPISAQNQPAVLVEGLTKSYGFLKRFTALDGINLCVEEGDIFALIGPNGAGKTTLMGCMLALLRPNSGKISIFGKPPDHIDVRSMVGFLPERPSFEPWMTAVQFLRFHQMLARRDGTDTAEQEIEEALKAVDLTSASRRKIGKYSRGMLQRLGLAQVLVGKPRLCFLDEPTSGLDPPGMDMVRDILLRFRQSGITAIVNSHHLDEIERACTRFAFMRAGKIETQEDIVKVNSKLLIAKWAIGSSIPSRETVSQAISATGASLAESDEEHAKIVLNARSDAQQVISSLVRNEIFVEEVYFDRRGLSGLFKADSERRVRKEPVPSAAQQEKEPKNEQASQRKQGGEEPSQLKRDTRGGGEGTEADGAIKNEQASQQKQGGEEPSQLKRDTRGGGEGTEADGAHTN